MRGILQHLRDGLISLTYPQSCRVCGKPVESWSDGVVCAPCWQDPAITRLFLTGDSRQKAACQKCGVWLPEVQQFFRDGPPLNRPERFCGRCGDYPWVLARACGAYGGSLEASLLFLKTQPHLCERLRSLIRQSLVANRQLLTSDVVVPIPLSASRKTERGYNQSEIIAAWIASHFRLALDTQALVRVRHSERHRAGLDALDRARSLQGAFAVRRGSRLCQQTILLVDDVFTTGSTLRAATEVLLEAGALRVQVFTIARVRRLRSSTGEIL